MRELTAREIDMFDRTGRVPDLHVGGRSKPRAVAAKRVQAQRQSKGWGFSRKRAGVRGGALA